MNFPKRADRRSRTFAGSGFGGIAYYTGFDKKTVVPLRTGTNPAPKIPIRDVKESTFKTLERMQTVRPGAALGAGIYAAGGGIYPPGGGGINPAGMGRKRKRGGAMGRDKVKELMTRMFTVVRENGYMALHAALLDKKNSDIINAATAKAMMQNSDAVSLPKFIGDFFNNLSVLINETRTIADQYKKMIDTYAPENEPEEEIVESPRNAEDFVPRNAEDLPPRKKQAIIDVGNRRRVGPPVRLPPSIAEKRPRIHRGDPPGGPPGGPPTIRARARAAALVKRMLRRRRAAKLRGGPPPGPPAGPPGGPPDDPDDHDTDSDAVASDGDMQVYPRPPMHERKQPRMKRAHIDAWHANRQHEKYNIIHYALDKDFLRKILRKYAAGLERDKMKDEFEARRGNRGKKRVNESIRKLETWRRKDLGYLARVAAAAGGGLLLPGQSFGTYRPIKLGSMARMTVGAGELGQMLAADAYHRVGKHKMMRIPRHLKRHFQGTGFWSSFKDGFMNVVKTLGKAAQTVLPIVAPFVPPQYKPAVIAANALLPAVNNLMV